MSEIKAFPVPSNANDWGMSLRDYFAAAALPVCMEMTSRPTEVLNIRQAAFEKGVGPDELTLDVTARAAYKYADAMLKAREAKP